MRNRRHPFPAACLLLTVVLAGSLSMAVPVSRASYRSDSPRSLIRQAAALFLHRFQEGKFAAQWAQLSPAARATWPSRAARTAMLARKFGRGEVSAIWVGRPLPGGVWTSHENPARAVGHTWRVPVAVRFRHPNRLRPAGVASAYSHLDLVLSLAGHHPLIVGEGPASLDAPLLVPARLPLRQTRVPILMYHRVGPYPARAQWTDAYGYAIEYGLTVSPAQFAAELHALAAHGYRAISLTRLTDALLYGLPLPPRAVVFTFDDGRQSPWTHAVPLLRRYGFTAEFFMCAGFAGETNQTPSHLNVQHYLTWAQVSALSREGFWLEDHGQKDLQVLWDLSPGALRVEVGQSARVLAAHTHQPIQFVAYTGALWPYPSATQVGPAQQALFPRLAALGYVGGLLDTRLPSVQERSTHLWQLPRVRVSPGESTARFLASLR